MANGIQRALIINVMYCETELVQSPVAILSSMSNNRVQSLTTDQTDMISANSKHFQYGITGIKWSHDSSHLAVLDASIPNTISVWNIADKGMLNFLFSGPFLLLLI